MKRFFILFITYLFMFTIPAYALTPDDEIVELHSSSITGRLVEDDGTVMDNRIGAYEFKTASSNIVTVCYMAYIYTVEKGSIPMVFNLISAGTTLRGDAVYGGYFYVDDPGISWGSIENPEAFYKIWFDISGRIDFNFYHVSVPTAEICTNYYCGVGCAAWWDCSIVPINTHVRHEYWQQWCP